MSERTALYRFYDADNTLLYIGITAHLGTRWRQHATDKPWWPSVRRQSVEWYDDRASALAAESDAIANEWPLYNVKDAEWRADVSPDGFDAVRVVRREAAVSAVRYDEEAQAKAVAEVEALTTAFEEARRVRDQARDTLQGAIVRHLRERNAPPGIVAKASPYDRNHVGRLARSAGVEPLRERVAAHKD